jgi:tRNA-specific 2-thiouridylase
LFVVALNAERREVVVGPREALLCGRFALDEVNLLADADFVAAARRAAVPVRVKVRSTRAPKPALLRLLEGARAEVIIPDGEEGVAPGQACVVYDDGARVLGGGFIAQPARLGAPGTAKAGEQPEPVA